MMGFLEMLRQARLICMDCMQRAGLGREASKTIFWKYWAAIATSADFCQT